MKTTPERMRGQPEVSYAEGDSDWIERLARLQQTASVEAACTLTYAVARGWWIGSAIKESAPAAWDIPRLSIAVGRLAPRAMAEAETIGSGLANLPVAIATGAIGRLYTRCLPDHLRSTNGVFYTPAPLVELLLDRAEESGHQWLNSRVIDPSCGAGAFLVEAASRMIDHLHDAEPTLAINAIGTRLAGWDIDPFAAWLAQVAVDIASLPIAKRAGRRLAVITSARDALVEFADGIGKFDLVIGNPPFGKVKDSETIRATFGRSLYGHPNLYGLFTDLAVRLAKAKGGRIAYLTPGSFLAGHYFSKLRELLISASPPISIDFIHSRSDVFEDVLQEVVLSTFERGRKSREVRCRTVAATPGGLKAEMTGDVKVPLGSEPWILPRTSQDGVLVAKAAAMPNRLSDWGYKVSTGPLVWNRHRSRLHDKPGRGRVPIIWAEAVQRDGRFSLQWARRGHKGWFEPRPQDTSMLVERPCVLVQRTTSKEQHRRLISAVLPAALIEKHGQITIENHLNMVLAISSKPRVPVEAVAQFLASNVADRVLRCINASVAVSASELESMPLPTPENLLSALAAKKPEQALERLYGASE